MTSDKFLLLSGEAECINDLELPKVPIGENVEIWIFTLSLSWALVDDFCLRHLIDAVPASNTLSWR